MTIQLSPELEALVDRKVADGAYRTRQEVVEAALRALDEQERERRREQTQQKLEALLLEGVDNLDRGEVFVATPEYWQELRRDIAVGLEQLNRGEYVVLDEAEIRRIGEEGRARPRRRLRPGEDEAPSD